MQAHLDSCATCRQDIDLATQGARAARSLPVESPPPDLHRRVVGAGGGRGIPAWYRWAGAAAAAAAVIAIAIALPNVGSDPRRGAFQPGRRRLAGHGRERSGGWRRRRQPTKTATTTPRGSRSSHAPHRASSELGPERGGRDPAGCGSRRSMCLSGLREPAGRAVDAADPSQVRGRGGLHRRLSRRPGCGRAAGHRRGVGGVRRRLRRALVRVGSHLTSSAKGTRGKEPAHRRRSGRVGG